MDKQHLQNQKHLQKFQDFFLKYCNLVQFHREFQSTPIQFFRLLFQLFCYSFGIFVNRMPCSCHTPLEALVIVIFYVDNRFFFCDFFGEMKECGSAKRDKICKMNIKRSNSLKSPIGSSLIKILNSFFNCLNESVIDR